MRRVRPLARRLLWPGDALKGRIQQVADANPDQAEPIIKSAGLAVKKTVVRQKRSFVVKYGATSGTVRVVAKAVSTRASHEWQYSTDEPLTTLQLDEEAEPIVLRIVA